MIVQYRRQGPVQGLNLSPELDDHWDSLLSRRLYLRYVHALLGLEIPYELISSHRPRSNAAHVLRIAGRRWSFGNPPH